jgi:hypothetical protein
VKRIVLLLVAVAVVGVAALVFPQVRRILTDPSGAGLQEFSVGDARYSVRAYDGPKDTACVGLYRWTVWRDSEGNRHRGWRRQQRVGSCTWQQTTDGSGWVADAAYTSIANTDQRVFYGAVPEQVATVRLTLSTGPVLQAATKARSDLRGRFYVIRRGGFERADVIDSRTAIQWIKVTALDATGRRLNVY